MNGTVGSSATPLVRRLGVLAFAYFAIIAAFVVTLTAVYALPQDPIERNIASSAELMVAESPVSWMFIRDPGYTPDTYTDAIMLETSLRLQGKSALISAMEAVHYESPDEDGGQVAPVTWLSDVVAGKLVTPVSYARYWHGYQLFLRPVLLVTDYSGIRYLNILGIGLLGAFTLLGIAEQLGRRAALAFAAALLMTGHIITPASMQYASMTYVMLLAVLWVLALWKRGLLPAWDFESFFVVGMLAAFFDLLTAPLITLGMPLVVVLIACSKTEDSGFIHQMRRALWLSVSWCFGYLLSWSAKWVIGTVILGQDVLADAGREVVLRSGVADATVTSLGAVQANVQRLVPFLHAVESSPLRPSSLGPLDITALVIVLVLGAVVYRFRNSSDAIRRASAVLMVAPYPYIWFAVIKNHSSVHIFFTYRIQAVALFAIVYFLSQLVGRASAPVSGGPSGPGLPASKARSCATTGI